MEIDYINRFRIPFWCAMQLERVHLDMTENKRSEKLQSYYITMLAGKDGDERRKAEEPPGRMKDAGAVDALVGVLSDPDRRVRQKAAWTLKVIGELGRSRISGRCWRTATKDVRDMAEEAIRELKRSAMGHGMIF